MTTPSAIRLKETAITWKGLVVLTAESPDRNLLCRFSVYIANAAGVPVSLAAADLEHQRIVRQLATGTTRTP
jgi:hypothetical protein